MAAAVARQEDHLDAVQAAVQQVVGGGAEGALDNRSAPLLQTLDIVDAAAADDADDRPVTLFAQSLALLVKRPLDSASGRLPLAAAFVL